MAQAEDVLRARLTGSTALAALVGTRIYGGRAAEGAAAPFVQHRRISGRNEHALDGKTELWEGRFQIDCYGVTFADAVAVAREVVAAVSVNDADMMALADNIVDLFDDQVTPKLFRRVVDFITVERNS